MGQRRAMSDVAPPPAQTLRRSTVAGLLITANKHLRALGLAALPNQEIFDALKVSRNRGYEVSRLLQERLSELVGKPGRPPKPEHPEPPPADAATEVLQYIYGHPGCIVDRGLRKAYSDRFRHFIVELRKRHKELTLEQFSQVTAIPAKTLQMWLSAGSPAEVEREPEPKIPDLKGAQLKTILAEYERWEGNFTSFCDHVQSHLHIPLGRTAMQTLLQAYGVRLPRRRPGRSPDELALADSFRTWFPHAQWEGDGSQVPVLVDGELFVFNLELAVDAYSGAFVGAAVTGTEDSEAVIETFRQAVADTGVQPLSLLLDNKPSNHCDPVVDALDDTILIRSTPCRGQSKPHVEGAFGLLKPNLEGLELLTGGTREQLAASFLRALIAAVLRTLNYRPRKAKGGRRRVDIVEDTPTEDEVEEAKKALLELQAKQRKARETRNARQNPVSRARLEKAFAELHLDDPEDHILSATARYPLDAIVEGIAIYTAKGKAGSLPEGVDARYLLGIVRNLAEQNESWELSRALWDQRVAAQDEIVERLEGQRERIEERTSDDEEALVTYIDRALQTASRLQRFFWLNVAGDLITLDEEQHHQRLFRICARRISNTHKVSLRERHAAMRFLAAQVRPLN